MQNVPPLGQCQNIVTFLSLPFGFMGGYILGAWSVMLCTGPESEWPAVSAFLLGFCTAQITAGLCSGIRQPVKNMSNICMLPFVAAHNLASILTQCGLVRAGENEPLLAQAI